MSAWGNKDGKAVTGTTVNVINGSKEIIGTGAATAFTTNFKVGDVLTIVSGNTTKNRVASVANNTHLLLADVFTGTTNNTLANAGVTVQEQPKSFYNEANFDAGFNAIQKVFGVDTTEVSVGSDNVVDVQVVGGGTLYVEAPVVAFSGGGGSSAAATATIAGGAVTSIAVTNVGSAYTSAPAVTIPKARLTVPTTGVAPSPDLITYTAHGLVANSAVVYNNGGGASATGLTSANTYYVATAGLTSSTFELKSALTSGTIAATVATVGGVGTLAATVAVSGSAGQFTCGGSTLAAGDLVTITGTLGGTGTITGYVTGTIYKVSAVTGVSPGVSGFTLTTTGDVALVTTAGSLTGLTYVTTLNTAAGTFSCGASTLAAGDRVTITGTLGGTGTIAAYATGTTYKVTAVTGVSPNVTAFTLQTNAGAAIVSTPGTLTGLTYLKETVIDISGTGNNAQYFEKVASVAATASSVRGSGDTGSHGEHAGWVKKIVGTGGRAGRIQYETLVAMGSITGDAPDDIQFPDA